MFKRTCKSVTILVAMLCLIFGSVEARDTSNIGNGNGGDSSFHESVFQIPKPPNPTPDPDPTPDPNPTPNPGLIPDESEEIAENNADNWIVYWYACGTDIETKRGDITTSLKEAEDADFSNGKVKIFLQAGGAVDWKHPSFAENSGTKRSWR